jgi:hypothetical protein
LAIPQLVDDSTLATSRDMSVHISGLGRRVRKSSRNSGWIGQLYRNRVTSGKRNRGKKEAKWIQKHYNRLKKQHLKEALQSLNRGAHLHNFVGRRQFIPRRRKETIRSVAELPDTANYTNELWFKNEKLRRVALATTYLRVQQNLLPDHFMHDTVVERFVNDHWDDLGRSLGRDMGRSWQEKLETRYVHLQIYLGPLFYYFPPELVFICHEYYYLRAD